MSVNKFKLDSIVIPQFPLNMFGEFLETYDGSHVVYKT